MYSSPVQEQPPLLTQTQHRITEWFRLEGTLKIIWFRQPAMGHLPLEGSRLESFQPSSQMTCKGEEEASGGQRIELQHCPVAQGPCSLLRDVQEG